MTKVMLWVPSWVLMGALGLLSVGLVHGQNAGNGDPRDLAEDVPTTPETRRKAKADKNPKFPATTLKVYEWGVTTMNWNGSKEADMDADVPDWYYDASEIPEQSADVKPDPKPAPPRPNLPPRPSARKPVLYFVADNPLKFDLDVLFTDGTATWAYPKPNRKTAKGAMYQWDNVALYPKGSDTSKLPTHHDADPEHWTAYSREGSEGCTLVVNGEREDFIFYEGDQNGLPQIDVIASDDGVTIRNHGAWPLLDLRVTKPTDNGILAWHVARVDAAKGESPGEAILTAEDSVAWDEFSKSGNITKEAKANGLLESQAKVFERAWQDVFYSRSGTVSWRRSNGELDAQMVLRLTVEAGVSVETERLQYTVIRNIDFAKAAELHETATKAANGDDSAFESLRKSGMAGISSVRSAMADESVGLKERMLYAKLLARLVPSKN